MCSRYTYFDDTLYEATRCAEMNRIRSTLTSLTTVLRPDGKMYQFRLIDQPVFLEQELPQQLQNQVSFSHSSPCLNVLCQGYKCRAYFMLAHDCTALFLVAVYETGIPPGYDVMNHMSVEINATDTQPFVKLLSRDAQVLLFVQRASKEKLRVSIFSLPYTLSNSKEYYLNVQIH